MARAAQFNIWESKTRRGRFYRSTVLGKRTTDAKPDQSFPTLPAAVNAVAEEWIAYAKALGVYGTHTKQTFLATHPIPYAPGSLRPAMVKVTIAPSLGGMSGLHKAMKAGSKRIRKTVLANTKTGQVTEAKTMKPTALAKKARKVAKKIQRIAAVEKIIEGAKIGKDMAYSAPPSKGRMVLVKRKREVATA